MTGGRAGQIGWGMGLERFGGRRENEGQNGKIGVWGSAVLRRCLVVTSHHGVRQEAEWMERRFRRREGVWGRGLTLESQWV